MGMDTKLKLEIQQMSFYHYCQIIFYQWIYFLSIDLFFTLAKKFKFRKDNILFMFYEQMRSTLMYSLMHIMYMCMYIHSRSVSLIRRVRNRAIVCMHFHICYVLVLFLCCFYY